MNWEQTPALPAPSRPWGAIGLALAALALPLVGPAVRSEALPHSRLSLILVVGGLAGAAMAALADRLWPARLAVAAAAGLLLFLPEGLLLALWLPEGLILADWAVRRRRPVPWVPAPRTPLVLPLVAVTAGASLAGSELHATVAPLIITGLGFLLTAHAVRGGASYALLDRAAAALSRVVGAVTSRLVFTVLGLFVVIVPWLFQRLTGSDPLAWSTPKGSGWAPRNRRAVQPKAAWTTEAAVRRRDTRQVLRFAAPFLAVALFAGIVQLRMKDPPAHQVFGPTGALDKAVAQEGEPWYDEYLQDMDWVSRAAWRLLSQERYADVKTRHVNVIDGNRKTWQPPACGCTPLVIWAYGGSTMFGVGQRDEHTIASELARQATAAGYDVEVVNRGISGEMHWMEANRLAFDLVVDEPAPDLVVFYDGVNEIWGARRLDDFGLGDPKVPADPQLLELQDQLLRDAGEPPEGPPGSELVDPDAPDLDPEEIGRLATRRFADALEMSASTAEAHDIPVRYFWQPSRLSRPPVEGEPGNGKYEVQGVRKMYESAEGSIPEGVVDLTGVFDDVPDALFTDDVHTNERGAELVAQAIFRSIRPDLERLS